MSGVPKWGRKGDAVPSKNTSSKNKKMTPHQDNPAAEPKTTQPVLRIVREGAFVHCYLACGHMVTMHKEDLKEPSPPSIKCWACEEESKQVIPPSTRF